MWPCPEERSRLRNSHCQRKGAEGCVPVGPEAARGWSWWEGVSRGGRGLVLPSLSILHILLILYSRVTLGVEPLSFIPIWQRKVPTLKEIKFPSGNFHFSLSCIGEGNGNPLQCFCLENPRDGGAWWAAVSGVAQSQTRLK